MINLPNIYNDNDNIVDKFNYYIESSNNNLCILKTPTGYGKTVMCCREIAKYLLNNDINGKCDILMPFRISVKNIYKYLQNLNSKFDEGKLKYKYSMSKESEGVDDYNVHIQTVGYWLEKSKYVEGNVKYVVLDEAHDTSWQTELATYILKLKMMNKQIKLIISSATINILDADMLNPNITYLINDEKSNTDIIYNDKHNEHIFNTIKNEKSACLIPKSLLKYIDNKKEDEVIEKPKESVYYIDCKNNINDILYAHMCNVIINIKNNILQQNFENCKKHILVIMPGKEEIYKLMRQLMLYELNGFKIHLLYSQINNIKANNSINDEMSNKIIISTNMCENAITINNIYAVVDSCIRKNIYEYGFNISELKTEYVSLSSITQSCGRTGRQNIRGISYLMLSSSQCEKINHYNALDTTRYNIQYQILLLLYKNIDIYDIFKHIKISKLKLNIQYLINRNIIDDNMKITNVGEKILKLVPNINISRLILNIINNDKLNNNNTLLYYLTIICSWIDVKNINIVDYDKYSDFHKNHVQSDSLDTFVYIWDKYITYGEKWCIENNVNLEYIYAINDNKNNIKYVLKKNFNITIDDSITGPVPVLDKSSKYVDIIKYEICKVYNDSIFSYSNYKYNISNLLLYDYNMLELKDVRSFNYVINMRNYSNCDFNRFCALSQRKNGKNVCLSNIICINDEMNLQLIEFRENEKM